eukprot:maker-scaffold442_size170051-snap-gene-0.30 protein:Tk02852 transcript:maker-scaffold442_size170051-snap-gene-0.30-mRNA-1 annotation:"Cullin-5"
MLKDKNALSFEDKWPQMRPTLLKLLRQLSVSRSEWQDLFWLVHSVCLWDEKGAPKVYAALREDILDFIKQAQERVLAHQEDQALLKAYIAEWRKFFTQCGYLPKPFGQLETALQGKTTTSVQKGKPTEDHSVVRKLMLDSWNQSIFSNIKERLQSSAMKLVHHERNGEAFDSQLVIGVRESYVNLSSNTDDKLQIYRENFERAYIQATEQFYWLKAPEYLLRQGVQDYMRYAESKLREEELRAQKYLESSSGSVQNLVKSCVDVLVTAHKETILAECAGMIKTNETDKLQLLFKLMDRVPDSGISPMLHDLEDHIYQTGIADMIESADVITQDCEKYVERLLELFRRFSLLVHEAFHDDPRFMTSRDMAFKRVVNDTSVFRLEIPGRGRMFSRVVPESKCPELLANYCDILLRKNPVSKKLTSDEIEAKLREVLLVLKYVQNKDVFMRYAKGHLTRRLILETSADSEMEENMVEWLREVGMPADFINKLSRMFQDIKVSEDLNSHFKDYLSMNTEKQNLSDIISIKILNQGAWAKSNERQPVSLPRELEDFIPEVEEFYKGKHSGRKLLWHHHMSNGTITFANNTGKYDLEVTTFQMAVLFCWENRRNEKLTLDNLKLATELPDSEIRRTLWGLVCMAKLKRQILLYDPPATKPNDFTDHTQFWINHDFAMVKNGKLQKRGKVSLIGRLQLCTDKAKEEENEGIMQLRIFRTQEAIIKILKMRKRINNAQLQTELVDILKNMFLPSKKMIKEQIEWLIENKYMKRDEDNINTFIYMA